MCIVPLEGELVSLACSNTGGVALAGCLWCLSDRRSRVEVALWSDAEAVIHGPRHLRINDNTFD